MIGHTLFPQTSTPLACWRSGDSTPSKERTFLIFKITLGNCQLTQTCNKEKFYMRLSKRRIDFYLRIVWYRRTGISCYEVSTDCGQTWNNCSRKTKYRQLENERYYRYCKRCLHGPPMHGLQIHLRGRLLFVWDITITSVPLHVPYKSELIIT